MTKSNITECPVCHGGKQQDRPCVRCSYVGIYDGWPLCIDKGKADSLVVEARRYSMSCAENMVMMAEALRGSKN